MTLQGNISSDAVIHPECRICGEKTSIGPGCEIGLEAPVTLVDCQLGRNVKLKGGYFERSVFLDGSNMGSGAHVRAGTVLEEESGGAHTVGLKQTVLLPFVTLGSLINFCDILMAGGTSRENHSEVGSSYIHFNYTPHQDKATASLIGDVPRGVLLNENPVFLGGQGGLVGPARIAFGSVIAAGAVCRADIVEENQLVVPPVPKAKTVGFEKGRYRAIERIVRNNLIYIGNIKALRAWYENVRVLFVRDEFDQAAVEGALSAFDLILNERVRRLQQLGEKAECFPGDPEKISDQLNESGNVAIPAELKSKLQSVEKRSYIDTIRNIEINMREHAAAWLQQIVDETGSIQ